MLELVCALNDPVDGASVLLIGCPGFSPDDIVPYLIPCYRVDDVSLGELDEAAIGIEENLAFAVAALPTCARRSRRVFHHILAEIIGYKAPLSLVELIYLSFLLLEHVLSCKDILKFISTRSMESPMDTLTPTQRLVCRLLPEIAPSVSSST